MQHAHQLLVILAATLVIHSGSLVAQDSFTPRSLDSIHANMFPDTLFSKGVGAFVLGHQWGPADLDKINTALRMNERFDQKSLTTYEGPFI